MVRIEPASPADLPVIWDLYQSIWLATYLNEAAGVTQAAAEKYLFEVRKPSMLDRWQRCIANPEAEQRCLFVAREGGEILGMVVPSITAGKHQLNGLYVRPEVRGKGIGTQLLETALDWIGDNDSYLYVAPYLPLPQKLYEEYGYKLANNQVHYFKDNPVPHLLMERSVEP